MKTTNNKCHHQVQNRTNRISRFIIICSMVLLPFLASADKLTAADFIAMDLAAREVTVNGVKDRLLLLQYEAGLGVQLESDSETQTSVSDIYKQWGVSSAQAIHWASNNTDAIEQWLALHPELQDEYDRIAVELDALSQQIQALANP